MPMNTANKLTLLRVFLIPVFLVVAYWGFPGSRYVALAIYIVACLTETDFNILPGLMPSAPGQNLAQGSHQHFQKGHGDIPEWTGASG